MAKQSIPDNRTRRFLGRVFDRKTPPVPSPAPVEEKRDERERDEAAQAARTPSNPVRTAFYTGNTIVRGRPPVAAGPRNEFGRVNEPQSGKIEREIQARFKTERGRSAARAAYDDARILADKNIETLERNMEKYRANLDRLVADRRPAPPEAALHVNQQFEDHWSAYQHGKDEIQTELEAALQDIEVEEFWTPNQTPLIGYSPDVTGKFNRAVGPMPVQPERSAVPTAEGEGPSLTARFRGAAEPPPDIEEDEAAVYDRQGYLDQMNRIPPTPQQGSGIDIDP